MNPKTMEGKNWEKEFDKKWDDFQNDWCCSYPQERKRMKSFIQKVRQEAVGEYRQQYKQYCAKCSKIRIRAERLFSK